MNTKMDLPQSEQKISAGARRVVTIAKFLESVLQDVIFFFVMSCVAVLIIWSFIIAVEDLAKAQKQHFRTQALSKTVNQNTLQRCLWPSEWCRLFANCQKIKHGQLGPSVAKVLTTAKD
ncbi:hypothetical protein KR222_002893 [Zaprionus bogoriensis]|nr:hypothetical protein KR222_002893 [Zaprionus bogoriensis]